MDNECKALARQKAVIFDIDGTLSKKHATRDYYDYSTVDQDGIIQPVFDVLKMYIESGYHIIFCSGREVSCIEKTREWLSFHLDESVARYYAGNNMASEYKRCILKYKLLLPEFDHWHNSKVEQETGIRMFDEKGNKFGIARQVLMTINVDETTDAWTQTRKEFAYIDKSTSDIKPCNSTQYQGYSMLFRKNGDHVTKDTELKRNFYHQHIKEYYNVEVVFDDRKSVKKMWTEEGLFVFDVNQKDLVY